MNERIQESVARATIVDGNEYVYECKAYYARSRVLARAEELVKVARRQLQGVCEPDLHRLRIMPDWSKVDAKVVEAMEYLEQYLTIETYGKSTTYDDLSAMSVVDYKLTKLKEYMK
jgi:hypothetical protein